MSASATPAEHKDYKLYANINDGSQRILLIKALFPHKGEILDKAGIRDEKFNLCFVHNIDGKTRYIVVKYVPPRAGCPYSLYLPSYNDATSDEADKCAAAYQAKYSTAVPTPAHTRAAIPALARTHTHAIVSPSDPSRVHHPAPTPDPSRTRVRAKGKRVSIATADDVCEFQVSESKQLNSLPKRR